MFEFYKECGKTFPASRREYPFLESLLSFLELDHTADFLLFNKIESGLTLYSIREDQQYTQNAL